MSVSKINNFLSLWGIQERVLDGGKSFFDGIKKAWINGVFSKESISVLLEVPFLITKQFSNDLSFVDCDIVFSRGKCLRDYGFDRYEELFSELSILCADNSPISYQWSLLSGRIKMYTVLLNVSSKYSEACEDLGDSVLADWVLHFVRSHKDEMDLIPQSSENYKFGIASVMSMSKSYLKKKNNVVLQSPQYMYLDLAIQWFGSKKCCCKALSPDGETSEGCSKKIEQIRECYNYFRNEQVAVGSPQFFNSATKKPNMTSCFLTSIGDDLDSLSTSWRQAAFISKGCGGNAFDYSYIRSSEIGSDGNMSDGVIPWIQIHEKVFKTVNQGGKRNGSGAVYLKDFHLNIMDFVCIRLQSGPEELRARDCFPGICVSDEFMRRVEADEKWTLMCPNYAKGLNDVWGDEYTAKYIEYEKENLPHSRQINARDLWRLICKARAETGTPYIALIDPINRKSNQQNLGTIKISNLCSEITLYTDPETISSCNLGSLIVDSFVVGEGDDATYDFDALEKASSFLVRSLNRTITRCYYPTEITGIEKINKTNRPLAIGMMGLADTFAKMNLCWDSDKAKLLNRQIAETIYIGSLKQSCNLAKRKGPFASFEGSPCSKGLLQPDLWALEVGLDVNTFYTGRYSQQDIDNLRSDIMVYGQYNVELTSCMPTASISVLFDRIECFEPATLLLMKRKLLSGYFTVAFKYFENDMRKEGLWDTNLVKHLMNNGGSVQTYESTHPKMQFYKEKYKTIYEMRQMMLIDYALRKGRGPFVSQSQSLNLYWEDPDFKRQSSALFYGWKQGAKTFYYQRRKAPVQANTRTVEDIRSKPISKLQKPQGWTCEGDVCVSCAL